MACSTMLLDGRCLMLESDLHGIQSNHQSIGEIAIRTYLYVLVIFSSLVLSVKYELCVMREAPSATDHCWKTPPHHETLEAAPTFSNHESCMISCWFHDAK
jgi:hypothetical protein